MYAKKAKIETQGKKMPDLKKYIQQIQRRLISLCKLMIKKT
jgi:hypothetical protein